MDYFQEQFEKTQDRLIERWLSIGLCDKVVDYLKHPWNPEWKKKTCVYVRPKLKEYLYSLLRSGIANKVKAILSLFSQVSDEELFTVDEWKIFSQKLEIAQILQKKGVNKLYHFTPSSNLESIKERGLLSLSRLQQEGIEYGSGSNDLSHSLDRQHNRDNYVRLSFTKDSPMYFIKSKERSDLIWLEVDIAILIDEYQNVCYCSENAAKIGSKIYVGREGLESIKREKLFISDFDDKDERKKYKQAEILVPDHVPNSYIHFPKY